MEVSSINRELQVLRRMLHLATEWGLIEQVPKIKLLHGERHRMSFSRRLAYVLLQFLRTRLAIQLLRPSQLRDVYKRQVEKVEQV